MVSRDTLADIKPSAVTAPRWASISPRRVNKQKLVDELKDKYDTVTHLALDAFLEGLSVNKAIEIVKGKTSKAKANPLGAYTKVQATLIKKLEKLTPDEADRAVEETVKELRRIVSIKTGGATKKAA